MPGLLPNRYAVDFQTFHKLTWRQRLKLIFGYNILVDAVAVVHTRHGSVKTKVHLRLTRETSAPQQIQSNLTQS